MRAVCSAASRFEIRLSLEHFTRDDEWLSLADKVKAASALKAEGNARLKDGRANLAIRKYRGVLELLGRKVPPSSEAEARRLFISATLNLAAVYVPARLTATLCAALRSREHRSSAASRLQLLSARAVGRNDFGLNGGSRSRWIAR